ncbi:MAG: hypothetical protein FWE88_07770 [Phycisphaerae bacterium]|nr:hypothetical protein [Phycisphaerae bacterium]
MSIFPRFELNWTVSPRAAADGVDERRVDATVPGAVQLDWARANGWGEHWYADNWKQYGGLEDKHWSYKATLGQAVFDAVKPGERLFFVCNGVDYRYEVRLGETLITANEGMFTRFERDLTEEDAKPGDVVEVLIFPAPKSVPFPEDRVQANQSCKPAVSYGWDFHPRLIPLGIWDETYLEVRPACFIRDVECQNKLAADFSYADLQLRVNLEQDGKQRLRWRVVAPDSGEVFAKHVTFLPSQHDCTSENCLCSDQARLDDGSTVDVHFGGSLLGLGARVEQPVLWWPNGQGEPALYTSIVELLDGDGNVIQTHTQRIGFRRVKLVMAPGQWDRPVGTEFPKTRSEPPITMEINGRAIFCKGANWAPIDVFPGTIDRERYRVQLDLVRDANMNMLRCWGGGIVNKDAFFDLCDEYGIMVWQEFPLSCNRYEGTPEYLQVLEDEADAILYRLRTRACVVLWCGGNELFNCWSGMTDQDAAIRLLNSRCYWHAPATPFLPTSPVMGMGHGHYVFRHKDGRECFEIFQKSSYTAYTEFGVGGPCSAEELRRFIPAAELFPPRPGTAWQTHHAFDAWEFNSHLLLDVLTDYFGEPASLEELVANGQLMQQQGHKGIFEEGRRQKPRASMTLNWCFNEPWPCAANLSVVSWWGRPKAAYYGIKESLRPVLASARIPKFRWREGEWLTFELWLLNDSPADVPSGRVEASVSFIDSKSGGVGNGVGGGCDGTAVGEPHFLLGWDFAAQPANVNLPGPTVRFQLPGRAADRMYIHLRVPGRPEFDSTYVLLYSPDQTKKETGTRALNQ